ncbi:MAG TPA: molybdopterin-dependent oxidoreductase, partial [Cryptosporangiaceae bacterium]|nr:molybdopterin-dependent oxidoreductase [Cryptosporangiaceae bacterium]
LAVPQVDPESWQLEVFGRVAKPLTLSFEDFLRRPMIERDITLSCVSVEVGGNLNGTARWLGVPLKDLLDEVQPEAGADQLVSRSADGWTCGTPTAACRDGRAAMLAVAMNGEPLPVDHGFPVRMLVPGLYGYVSATKWITEIELTTFADFDSYWTERKWAPQAPVKTFSRIDTPKPFADVKAGANVVAGIAYRQHTGIKAVEVRIDNGPWQQAKLAAVPNDDTWVQWQLRWDATPGPHTLVCRATDKNGETQPEERVKPFPNGATGWHSVVATVA